MGVLNLTPNSFSDGGKYNKKDFGVKHAKKLFSDGCNIIDIGGESSRPGALPVQYDEETRRIMPVLKEIRQFNVPISVDTYKPKLMKEVLDQGALGLLVEPSSPNALARGIIEVLNHPDAAIKRAYKAKQKAMKVFTINKMANAYRKELNF